jgi:hypothetical protein
LGADLAAGPVVTPEGASLLSTTALRLPGNSDCGATVNLEVADVDGASGRIAKTTVASGFTPGVARIAANRRGDVAVAWVEVTSAPDGQKSSTLHAAVRPHGGKFGRGVQVASNRSYGGFDVGIADASVAINPDGSVLIAYEATPVLRVVTLSSDGELHQRQRLATLRIYTETISAATGGGRAFVVWSDQPAGMDGPQGLYQVRAAIRSSPRGTFGPAALLDPGSSTSDEPSGAPGLAVAGDGSAVLEWDNPGRPGTAPDPVKVAIAPPGRPFGSPTRVSTNGTPGQPAIADDGTAAIPWITIDDQVAVAIRHAHAARVGRSERVTHVAGTPRARPRDAGPASTTPPTANLEEPTAAIGLGGEPLVAWGAHFARDPHEDLVEISTRG